jgi:hypothetical protein
MEASLVITLASYVKGVPEEIIGFSEKAGSK